jgi:hypothetical protein
MTDLGLLLLEKTERNISRNGLAHNDNGHKKGDFK